MRLALVCWSPLVLLAACTDQQMTDLTAYVEKIKSRPASGISPPPTYARIAGFTYAAEGRRDPFLTPTALLATRQTGDNNDVVRPNPQRRKETLENHPLDSLRMVGTLMRADTHWALVRSQDGVIHKVTIGNHMGQRHGRVVDIQENRISLVELAPVSDGFREKKIALRLERAE